MIAEERAAAKVRRHEAKKWKSEMTSPVPSHEMQEDRIIDALGRHFEARTGRKLRASKRRELARPYGRRAAGEMRATNPYAHDIIAKKLLAAIERCAGGQSMLAVTLYHPHLNGPLPEDINDLPNGYLEDLITGGRAHLRKVFLGFSYVWCEPLSRSSRG